MGFPRRPRPATAREWTASRLGPTGHAVSASGLAELRLVVTTADFDAAVHLYRDVLGLPEPDGVISPQGRVTILDAGRATLTAAGAELLAPPTPTPWGSRNARFEGAAGLQLTLFGV